jgi:hypothetical protein
LAIDQIGNANLKDLLNKNADLFSFDLTTIAHRDLAPSGKLSESAIWV